MGPGSWGEEDNVSPGIETWMSLGNMTSSGQDPCNEGHIFLGFIYLSFHSLPTVYHSSIPPSLHYTFIQPSIKLIIHYPFIHPSIYYPSIIYLSNHLSMHSLFIHSLSIYCLSIHSPSIYYPSIQPTICLSNHPPSTVHPAI